MKNNRKIEEDNWFTPKKVLAYSIIIGLVSGTLSIFINSLIVLSVGAFVFASITIWYIFGDKFHTWEEKRPTWRAPSRDRARMSGEVLFPRACGIIPPASWRKLLEKSSPRMLAS